MNLPAKARYLLLHFLMSAYSLDVANGNERLPENYANDIRLVAK